MREEEVVVADVGCSRGHSKLFVGDLPDTRWLGLDMNINENVLRECGYSEMYQCDFDQPMPLPDNSVDVVVFSHVVEHLLRPDFTAEELSRILKPGGMIIAGSPVAPWPISWLREWQLRRRLRTNRIQLGRHINSMSTGRWKRLFDAQDMSIERMTGTFLVRWSGNPLENQVWWTRLNQLWGALFPALGGEIYLTARKPILPLTQRKGVAAEANDNVAFVPKWAWGAAALLVCVAAWGIHSRLLWESCPVHQLVDRHQDGNDRFYLLTHPAFDDVKPHASIGVIRHHLDVEAEHEDESAKQVDAHFLVSIDVVDELEISMSKLGLRIVEEVDIDGHRVVLLSSETYGQQSDAADG